MALRYWIGGGTNANWNASPTTNWAATSGGAVRVAVPTSADDVIFDGAGANGNTNSTISATITVLSLTITSGYTATMTHNAVLTVAGNVTLGANYTIAGSSSMTISATSTITSNGKTWPNAMTWSNSHTTTLVGDFTIAGQLNVNNGTFPLNKTTTEVLYTNGLVSTGSGSVSGTITKIVLTGGSWESGTSGSVSPPIEITGNVTLTNNVRIGNGGSITYTSGTVTTTGSTLIFVNDVTLNTNGIVFNNVSMITNNPSVVINSLFSVGGTLTTSVTCTFSGTSGWQVHTFNGTHTNVNTITLKEGITYTITSALTANTSRVDSILLFTSSHASNKAILTLNYGATCAVLASFTRINASNGRPIRSFFGTITDCDNIVRIEDIKSVAA